MTAYRISVAVDVDVNTAGPATRGELVKIGERIALGTPPNGALLASPVTETIAVVVQDPECQDTAHRRNSIDDATYQCGAAESDAIHGSLEACEAGRGSPCHAPAEHHAYVSPGFEAPAS
ncbi:MAG: hypothetical protein AB1627_01170 [Chloroflexota bacterium]